MTDAARHAGRSVLVTGSASGIGLAIAERFLAEGARVAGLDLRPTAIAHDRFLSLTGDAAAEGDVTAAVAAAAARHGGLDVMVLNAGVIAVTPFLGMPFAEWRRVMSVNVDSVFLGAQAAARQMVAQGRGGVIITAASGAGRRGVPNLAHYCASKAAIINLTQTLAIELAPHGIRANSYVPGHIETPFWGGIAESFARVWNVTPAEAVARFRATVPAGRFGTPADVAAAVSWLASPDADYVSGHAIAMNGAEFPW
jgi:NAD(P)-dependent dehydrogenase (short-subunit alcohol dehydrogenase family)